jgi:TatD DNase family protein
MSWVYDSHIHLSDPQYKNELPTIITSMEKMKIKACCVSMNVENSIQTISISEQSDLILPFVGIHPEYFNDTLGLMNDLIIKNNKIITGIGEIGLDTTYTKNEDDFDKQKTVFESMLSLAEKYHKPVSIHSRKTLDEIYDVLTSFNLNGVLLHWFDGSKKQLSVAMDRDYFVSYGPVMVYANDKQVLLKYTRKEKILVETDGPVRFSKCFGLKPAQISFIPSVVFCASKLLKISYTEMSKLLEKNSEKYLGI